MRHRTRHVHQTVVQHLQGQLAAMGWTQAPVNYGTTPVAVQSVEPYGEGAVQPDGNLVAITLGEESPDEEEQLGGGLLTASWMLYVDVIGASIPVSVAIADDMKAALKNQAIELRDFTSSPAGIAVPGAHVEFDEVGIDIPPSASGADRRTWRVVSAMARVLIPDDTAMSLRAATSPMSAASAAATRA
jgi:hypothetical protein